MLNMSPRVFETLSLLTPYDIDLEKLRVGTERDGAYIIVDLPSSTDIMSFGVSTNVDFELDMAARGHRSFMYDHTIDACPVDHPQLRYYRKGICGTGESDPDLLPLDELMAQIPDLSNRLLLKIDVEGHEWNVFSTIAQETLARYDQILVEFHWMRHLADPTFRERAYEALKRINQQFTLYHVHGNNFAEMHMIEGFPVVDVIELSYVRTTMVNRTRSRTVYPTSINKANHFAFHDHPLLFFPFLPCAVDRDRLADMVYRIDADKPAG